MNVASRPVTTGKTRTCPGCLHHLRFDQDAAKRQVAATSALRVEAVVRHPPLEEAWEYYVVIAIRNDKGEEIARQVVNVGALQPAEKRSFSFSVEVLPPQAPPEPGQQQSSNVKPAAVPLPLQAPPYKLNPPGVMPGQAGYKPGSTPAPAPPTQKPTNPSGMTPAQAAGLKPPPIGGGPPKKTR
jgi:hypothetical protein